MEEVDQAQHLGLGELVGLRAQAVARLRSHREGVGHLAHVLDEEQVTQVLEQVVDEPREVLSLVGELLDEGKEAGRVAVDDQVAEAEERLLVDRPEKLEDGLDGDLAVGRGRKLVERRDRVAEAPTCAAGDQRERGVRGLDLLSVGDQAQELRQLGEAGPREEERLAARAHRGEDLVELGRAEDEDEVRRRLFDQLQERVPGGIRQLVRLVEDVDLEAALDRLEDDVVADLADVVDPALAGGVHLDDVQRDAVGDRHAGVAGLVRRRRRALLAVERLGEDSRQRRLPGPARAREEVCLPHLVVGDRVAKRPHDRLLADDLVEVLRPVFAVEGGHPGHRIEEGARGTRGSPKRGGSPRGNQGFPRVMPGSAPSVEDALGSVPTTLALTRSTRGPRERLLSAASSRT